MKLRIQTASMAMVAVALYASQATAQLCGVSIDCNWPTPTVGHWTFDDLSSGNAIDDVNGNTGFWDGGAGNNSSAEGIIGSGSQTNDEDGGNGQEHYTINAMPQLNGAAGLTISLWFNQNVANNNNSTYNGLFMTRFLESSFGGGGENWGVAIENNNTPRHIDWRIDGVPGAEDDLILGNLQDEWHHVVFTWDGNDQGDGMGERALFLDGVELQRQDGPLGTITSSGSWDIGNDTCCGNREFSGTLDDLAVWNTAFSATDAIDLYNAGLAGVNASKVEPPLMGDVDLDGDVDYIETDNDGISDYDALVANFLEFGAGGAERADGDLNGDGMVNFVDYAEWKTAFDALPVSSGLATVPEPTALCLIGIAVMGCGLTRRCK